MEIAPHGTLGLLPSMIIVYGVGVFFLGTLLWLAIAQVVRNQAREKLARELPVHESRPLEEGPAIVRGRVELRDAEASEGVPVRLAIHQKGKQYQTKAGTETRWVETHRELKYRPFYLRLPSGERIRVVPNSRVMLADDLDRVEASPDDRTRRARVAELVVGEEVIASGVIKREKAIAGEGAGYRGGGTVMVMRAPPQQKLLLSTSPLEHRFQQCAQHYRNMASFIGVCMLFVHTVVFGSFHLLNARGEVVRATNVSTRTHETSYKGSKTTHYEIYADSPDGVRLTAEVSASLYQQAASWASVPFLVVPSDPTIHTIGTQPRASVFWLIGFVFAVIVCIAFYWYYPYWSSRLPWYERRRVVNVEEQRRTVLPS